jgi:hypothetical protein
MEISAQPTMEFDVHITEELLRRVALRRMFRNWKVIVAVAAGSLALLYRPNGHWGAGASIVVTALCMLPLIYLAAFIRDRRVIAAWKKTQGSEPVHYSVTEDTIKATSNLGSAEVKWVVFNELYEHRDYLLLSMGRSGHLTLPLADVPDEAEALIRRQFAMLNLPTKRA